jgi:hypothetical protein
MFNEILKSDFDKLSRVLQNTLNIDFTAISHEISDDVVGESYVEDGSGLPNKAHWRVSPRSKSAKIDMDIDTVTPKPFKIEDREKLSKDAQELIDKTFKSEVLKGKKNAIIDVITTNILPSKLKDHKNVIFFTIGDVRVNIGTTPKKSRTESREEHDERVKAAYEVARLKQNEYIINSGYSDILKSANNILKKLEGEVTDTTIQNIIRLISRLDFSKQLVTKITSDSLKDILRSAIEKSVANTVRIDLNERNIKYVTDLLQRGDAHYRWYNDFHDAVVAKMKNNSDAALFLCTVALTSPKSKLDENIQLASVLYYGIMADKKSNILNDVFNVMKNDAVDFKQAIDVGKRLTKREIILRSTEFKQIDLRSIPSEVVNGETTLDGIINNMEFTKESQFNGVKLIDGTLINDHPNSDLFKGMLLWFSRVQFKPVSKDDPTPTTTIKSYPFRSSTDLTGKKSPLNTTIWRNADGELAKVPGIYYNTTLDFFKEKSEQFSKKMFNSVNTIVNNGIQGYASEKVIDILNKSVLYKVIITYGSKLSDTYIENLLKIIYQYSTKSPDISTLVNAMHKMWDGQSKFINNRALVTGNKVFSFTLNLLNPHTSKSNTGYTNYVTIDTWMLAFFFPALNKDEQEDLLKKPEAYPYLRKKTEDLTNLYNKMRRRAFNERKLEANKNNQQFTETFENFTPLQFQAVVWCAMIASKKDVSKYPLTYKKGVDSAIRNSITNLDRKLNKFIEMDNELIEKSSELIENSINILKEMQSSDTDYTNIMDRIEKLAGVLISNLNENMTRKQLKKLIKEIRMNIMLK